ncbi:GIP [Symbiodinium sp. CCMP2456]|nr:GIP [Symbiodinium sp. CCMP2456]
MGKKLMAMTTLMAATMSQLLLGLHLDGCEGLWEISGAPHSWMSDAAEQQGLRPRRINLRYGYDVYKKDTWSQLQHLRRQRRPRRIWVSLPCTKWCSWSSTRYCDEARQVQLATERRRERRMLWEAVSFLLETLDEDPSVKIYFEWPHPSIGWRQQPMMYLAQQLQQRGIDWLSCRIDGCRYDLRDPEDNSFILKKWMVKTNDEVFHQTYRAKVCVGNHVHSHTEGQGMTSAAYYPWKLVQSITRFWRDQLGPLRHARMLRQQEEVNVEDDQLDVDPWSLSLVEDKSDVEETPEVMIGQAATLDINAHAREASARQRYGFDDLERLCNLIYNYLGVTLQQHHLRWAQTPSQLLQLGLYSFGAFGGLTNRTHTYKEVVIYVNEFLRRHLPQQTWTSILINFNGRTLPHRDHNNQKGSSNILTCFGSFAGGGLWLQDESGKTTDRVRRRLANGSVVYGNMFETFKKFVIFSPETLHATQQWRGFRIAVTAYSSRMIDKVSRQEREQLRALGFPLPTTSPSQMVSIAEQTSSTTTGPSQMILVAEQTSSTTTGPSQMISVAEQTSSTTTGPTTDVDKGLESHAEGVSQEEYERWMTQVAKFHKAAGHPSNRNLARIVKDAGHPEWKVEAARIYQCPTCLSLKPGGTSSGRVPPASTHAQYGAWEAVAVDAAEWVPPGRKIKVKFLLFMDVATKLRVTCPLYVYDFLEMKAESSQDFMRSFTERWLGTYPKPRVVLMDSAKSLISETTHQYLSDLNILVHFIAEKESWAHGTVEAAVQDVKLTASAIYQDLRDLQPEMALFLATAALNSTEYTAGFSSFQWAFGKQYSLSDEDVRTFATTNYEGEYTRLVTLRQQAEEVAVRTRAKRVLSRLQNSTVRQPLREFEPFALVKIWRHVWPHEQAKGTRGGFRKSGRPHWAGPGRVIFQEVLPHQESGDTRRHIVWVLIGQRLFRCSVHSVRPVTEEEKFVYETTARENVTSWRTLADVLPKREYFDVVNEEPSPEDQELPDLPEQPDKTTVVVPTRRVRAKTSPTEVNEPESGTHSSTATSSQVRPHEPPDVNDYEQPAPKRSKADEPSWVDELYAEAVIEEQTIDIFHAMSEINEFLRIEIDIDQLSSNRQRKMLERNPVAFLAKKMRDSEVVISKLPSDERELFSRAKAKEDGMRKAKARIVLLGFQHPNLLDPSFKTASPVQSSLGRNLLYLMAAQHQWTLEGLDLATAFLQTLPTEADKELWTTGVEELREAIGVGPEQIMRILRNIYGSTTAPRGLWLALHKTLTSLGAQPVLGERCLWIWLSQLQAEARTIGAMGGHVDDFHRIGDGSEEWLAIKAKIDSAYRWGMTKSGNYRHAGTDITTTTDEQGYQKILVDQQYYVDGVADVEIELDRIRGDEVLSRRDVDACRTALGELQWLAVQTQPQLCARCNLLLTEITTGGTMSTAREIQQMIGEIRRESFKLEFRRLPDVHHWRDMVFISMGDQAHCNRPKGDSTGGLITLAAGPGSLDGTVSPMLVLGWRTWKLRRKAIGSNDAEVQSILEAEDHNFRTRLLWSELHGGGGQHAHRPLRQDLVALLEKQVEGINGILCTDSRGGYDAVERNESPLLGLSNIRAALQAFQLRDNLQRAGCRLRWLASDFDLADALTKKKEEARQGLLKMLRTGHWSIRFDPSFTSAKKGKKQGKSALEAIDHFIRKGRPRASNH